MMILISVLCLLLLGTEGRNTESEPESETVLGSFRGSEYTLLKKQQSWNTNRAECEALGMDLAVITEEDEQEYIVQLISKESNPKDAWIGLYKTSKNPSSLRWMDETPFVYDDETNYYQPWAPGEPSMRKVTCIRLRISDNGAWADMRCTIRFWAVCEKSDTEEPTTTTSTTTEEPTTTTSTTTEEPTTTTVQPYESSYTIYRKPQLNWYDAKAKCEMHKQRLAMFETPEKWKALTRDQPEVSSLVAWIGLYDKDENDRFVWVNGANVRWNNWYGGKPRHRYLAGGKKNCAAVYLGRGWATYSCANKYSFLCEGVNA